MFRSNVPQISKLLIKCIHQLTSSSNFSVIVELYVTLMPSHGKKISSVHSIGGPPFQSFWFITRLCKAQLSRQYAPWGSNSKLLWSIGKVIFRFIQVLRVCNTIETKKKEREMKIASLFAVVSTTTTEVDLGERLKAFDFRACIAEVSNEKI